MGVSLGGLKMKGEAIRAQEKIEKEFKKQQKKSKKRGFFSKILGGGVGKLLGAGLTGALGLTGFGVPIAMALGSMAGKKVGYEATRGMAADPSQIKAGNYGLGRGMAQRAGEGIESMQKSLDPMKTRGGFGAELLGATMTAGLAGDLKAAGKGLLSGDKGSLMGAFRDPSATGGLSKGLGGMWAGAKEEMGSLLGINPLAEGGIDEMEGIGQGDVFTKPAFFAQGGQVPNEQQQLLQLLALQQMQQPKTTYDDTALEENKQQTISEYFGAQGKTLGGSNTKSLSQLLGR